MESVAKFDKGEHNAAELSTSITSDAVADASSKAEPQDAGRP